MEDNIIFSYSRKQALEDGVLVDITEKAKEFGFRLPTAITASLKAHIEPPEGMPDQSFDGRLADVLTLAYMKASSASRGETRLSFPCVFRENDGDVTVEVFMEVGPGDDGKPVLTIMLEEDL